MPLAALVLYVVFVAVVVGLRVAFQLHRTGSTGLNRFEGAPGSAEWWASILLVGGILLAPLVPALVLVGVLEPVAFFDKLIFQAIGIALAIVGTFLVFGVQMSMGDSWRIGVDAGERTDLVTSGLFAIVRNPIYAAFAPVAIGILLMVANVFLVVDIVVMALALELQVRVVEEPHLLRVHGDAYRSYASRVGRFLPGIGFIEAPEREPEPAGVPVKD